MADIVGIDLGTTNSLIGIVDAGFPGLLADGEGERLTPSVVHFPAKGEPLVGRAAWRMRVTDPEFTVYSVKRLMGARTEDVEMNMPFRLVGQRGGPVRISARGKEYSPEEISSFILAKLKRDAESAMGREITRAVITVPAYFNDAQRNATKAAGELAGFIVERIINEPTAAALAYGLDKLQEKSKIAVYDLGGGTFDISILELRNGVFQVLSTNGNTRLGGDDIDTALVAACDLPISVQRRWEVVIQAKHRLSQETAVEIPLPFVEGKNLVYRLTREELEKIARPIVERTKRHCLRSLADAELTAGDIDEVILVGGATRMPMVRDFVAAIFGKEPNTSQHPDEAVAIGATIQAGILTGSMQNMLLLDITPLSLGIETFGGLMNVIIPRNSTIPTKAGEMFTNAMSGQSGMQIKVVQGERELAKDNWTLGQFEIPFEPAPKGQARVGVQFEIDANGILHVLARDVKSGREQVMEIRSAVDVSDEAVEAMISESIEHAFEDMNDRVFAEARLKSEELLPAVRKGLELAGSELDTEERVAIEAGIVNVKNALETGDSRMLKEANAALDAATQRLAAILFSRAVGEQPAKTGSK